MRNWGLDLGLGSFWHLHPEIRLIYSMLRTVASQTKPLLKWLHVYTSVVPQWCMHGIFRLPTKSARTRIWVTPLCKNIYPPWSLLEVGDQRLYTEPQNVASFTTTGTFLTAAGLLMRPEAASTSWSQTSGRTVSVRRDLNKYDIEKRSGLRITARCLSSFATGCCCKL